MIRQLALHDAKTQGPDAAAATAAPRGRASWSGLLRLSLVAVPIKAYPAVSTSETIRFNQLHADCGQRVRYEKHCPIHGILDGPSIVRGYEYAPEQYVVVEPSELDQLRPANDKALQPRGMTTGNSIRNPITVQVERLSLTMVNNCIGTRTEKFATK